MRSRIAAAAATMMLAACGPDGSSSLASAPAPQPASVALSGIVHEAGTMRLLSGVRLVVTSGPDAGASAVSDGSGAFVFSGLSGGPIDLAGTKDGYLAAKFTNVGVQPDQNVNVPLYAAPPRDATGAPATARCRDASWSWSRAAARVCSDRGGVATIYVSASR